MNSLRPELLELTPQALTALSNAGFVKRSLKELENGNVPEISHENDALIATFSDGVRTQLANGQALKEAQCSCGANGMCRHRVMLVLSYQRLCATTQSTEKEEEWDPAIWLEELGILHLSRSWPRSEQENSPAATRRLFSFQAGALAGGQIVSQAAKRSADGELLLATRNRLSSVVPLSPDAWQMLSAPLRQPGIVALREYLRQRPPACIRPLNQVDNLFILPVAECISLGWDSSRQTLDAQVISGEGEDNVLTLSLPASASAPYAVERMAALLQQTDDPVCLVSGFVSFVEGQLTLEPRVMMTKTRAWALDAETTPVAPLPSASVLPVPSTAHQLLIRCQALLIQLLHNGWRYQEQSAIGQA